MNHPNILVKSTLRKVTCQKRSSFRIDDIINISKIEINYTYRN